MDSLFATTAKTIADSFNKTTPQLNATLQLENYLQMEYEILSKQLTLLRDEVGPNERLLFLEMPQSIKASHDKADKRWAQSWWRIRGFTCEEHPLVSKKCLGRTDRELLYRKIEQEKEARKQAAIAKGEPAGSATPDPAARKGNEHPPSIMERLENLMGTASKPGAGDLLFLNEKDRDPEKMAFKVIFKDLNFDNVSNVIDSYDLRGKVLQNRMIRVVDLFPRQSSLNVNTLKLRSSALSLKFLFTLISGFGGGGGFQRQREQLSQFVQQELYSSAFGKGSREFGWTFNPMPGTKRLMSGVRTTYAVVVVPKEVLELVVESTGCYFRRHLEEPESFDKAVEWSGEGDSSYKGCSERKAFIIPVPNGGPGNTGFWVDSVYYKPVKKGDRIVVSIMGQDFSTQTGVLVNGVPLKPALGLAQPFILDDSVTGEKARELLKNEKITGSYERVGSEHIILAFNMPEDYEVPVITLVSPGKAINLNRLDLYVNSSTSVTKLDEADFMFGKRIGTNPTAIKIDKINVFETAEGMLNAVITGENFTIPPPPPPALPAPPTRRITGININGVDCTLANNCSYSLTQTLIRVRFKPPLEDSVYFTLISDDETLKAEPVDNPAIDNTPPAQITTNSALLRVERVKFLSSDSGIVVVQLIGSGFTDKLKADKGDLIVTSPTRAMLKIDKSILPEVVTLTNEQLKIQAKAVITGKPPERAQ